MRKRFKTRKKDKYYLIKKISILFIIYISFNLIYNLLYNLYLSKLSNEKIITHIINNTKNNKTSNSLLDKYKNPETILSEYFTINELKGNTLEVSNKLTDQKQVYIYCTHETESYKDKYLEVYNIVPSVKTMSYILKDYLIDLGVNTIVEDKSITKVLKDNNWSYKYSYEASKKVIEPTIKNNKDLKLIIDLHRDSSPLEKTLLNINDTNYAKILFVVGTEHQNYEKNYQVSKTLNDLLNNEVNSITRGITKKSGKGVNGIYNQDLNENIVLIELGGQYNEIEELNNTLKVLAKVILKYIEGEI